MGDYELGTRIFGKWKGGNCWFPGRIDEVDGKRYFIRYNDGDTEWIASSKLIQKDKSLKPLKMEKLKKGVRIIGNWRNNGKWYPSQIMEMAGDKLLVKYDDGDKEWISDHKLIQLDKTVKATKISKLKVGSRIQGLWKGLGTWYNGQIIDIKGSKVNVQYDDGDVEWIENLSFIRILKPIKLEKLQLGARIKGRWKGGGAWYSGKILEINNRQIHVLYDDGDEEWISDLSLIQKEK